MRHLLLLCACALTLSSCSTNITKDITKKYPPLDRFAEVQVIPLQEAAPVDAEQLGTVFVDDNGSTKNCSWNDLVEKIKREARKAGGNTVKIASHIPPGTAGSKCHQITAHILKTTSLPERKTMPVANPLLADSLEEEYAPFRLALNGGYSYRMASVPDNITGVAKNYIEGLKSGFHVSGDATYFASEKYGGGIKFSHNISSNSLSDMYRQNPDGSITEGTVSDNIGITFIGPSFTERSISSNRLNALITSIAVGYIGYTDKAVVINDNVTISGSTIGLAGDIGYEFGISPEFSVGLQLSYLIGKITTMEFDYGTKKETITASGDSGESLNRIDLSIGVRFNK